MRINPELTLRKIGRHYMIVDACEGNLNLANVYRLNATAAWLWESVGNDDFSAQTLATLLCRNYEVDPERALRDSERLISDWKRLELLV